MGHELSLRLLEKMRIQYEQTDEVSTPSQSRGEGRVISHAQIFAPEPDD